MGGAGPRLTAGRRNIGARRSRARPQSCNGCRYETDFYNPERDGSEREVAIRFRYRVGEEIFRALAIDNPRRFLGETR